MNIWGKDQLYDRSKMKETKLRERSEDTAGARASAMRKAWVEREKLCGEARTVLMRLETWLAEHTAALTRTEMLCSRLDHEGAGRLVRQGTTRCLNNSAEDLAKQLLRGKNLAEMVREEQRQLEAFYSSLNFGANSSDVVPFKLWDAERASCAILTSAISIQKKEMAWVLATSMERFSEAVRGTRSETGRAFLSALAEMKHAVAADQKLAENLSPEEIAMLKPRPFPLEMLSNDAIAWLLDAIGQRLLDSAEVGDLKLETVSTAEMAEAAPAGERWI